jgi:hypothetical protein
MSFARLLSKIQDRREGKLTIIPYIHKQVTEKQPVFSFLRVSHIVKKIHNLFKKPTENLRDDYFKMFLSLWEATYAPDKRMKKGFHASSLEDDCDRKLYYDFTDAPVTNPNARTPEPKLQMLFDLGTFVHTYIQFQLYKAGILISAEVPVEDRKLKVSSKTDGILLIDLVKYLLEIKTMNSFQFNKLTKPLEKHIFQASLYAHILKIKNIVFIYYNKDTSEMKEFFVPVDDVMVKRALLKMKDVLRDVEDKRLPDRICRDRFTDRAVSCVFCNHCFSKVS